MHQRDPGETMAAVPGVQDVPGVYGAVVWCSVSIQRAGGQGGRGVLVVF